MYEVKMIGILWEGCRGWSCHEILRKRTERRFMDEVREDMAVVEVMEKDADYTT